MIVCHDEENVWCWCHAGQSDSDKAILNRYVENGTGRRKCFYAAPRRGPSLLTKQRAFRIETESAPNRTHSVIWHNAFWMLRLVKGIFSTSKDHQLINMRFLVLIQGSCSAS